VCECVIDLHRKKNIYITEMITIEYTIRTAVNYTREQSDLVKRFLQAFQQSAQQKKNSKFMKKL